MSATSKITKSASKLKDAEWCPVEATLSLIGKKYVLLIIRDLENGPRRFGELLKSVVGISSKTLTERLYELEDMGVIVRKQYSEIPPRVEYTLTKKGASLKPVIESIREWGDDHKRALQNKA